MVSELVVGSPVKWLGREEPSDLLRSPAARLRGTGARPLEEVSDLSAERIRALHHRGERQRSKGHLSGIEKGLVLQTLALLAERLGVDLLDLVTFPEDSPRQRLVALTRAMTPRTVRRLIRDARG